MHIVNGFINVAVSHAGLIISNRLIEYSLIVAKHSNGDFCANIRGVPVSPVMIDGGVVMAGQKIIDDRV